MAPADLPSPEALSAVDAKDAGPLAEVAGEYLARCVFSRTWQLREAALVWLAKELEGGRMEGGSGAQAAGLWAGFARLPACCTS